MGKKAPKETPSGIDRWTSNGVGIHIISTPKHDVKPSSSEKRGKSK